METYIQSNENVKSDNKVKEYNTNFHRKNASVRKKFVNRNMLVFAFILTLLYISLLTSYMIDQPLYLIALIDIVGVFLVWNVVYQTLYDVKLLFFFKQNYDLDIPLPAGKSYPTIAFVVPSYREPFSVVKMTVDSIIYSPYTGKKEIIIVDNSNDITTDDFNELKNYIENLDNIYSDQKIIAKFIYNNRQDTLKPGNLDLAEQHIEEGEYVVILDVDSTLPVNENLLEKAVSEFVFDQKLGLIQFSMKSTNHHFNKLTEAISAFQDLHRLRLTCRSYGGYKVFEGHNGMWRKVVLDKVGAWTDYYKGRIMITEDILKSSQMYSNGYYGKSLSIMTGEWVPCSLDALESMWMRWTYGTSQVLFKCFHKIYSKQVSSIEKFDITYHVLYHFLHGLIFPMAILLQISMPGIVANIFIILVYVLPQLSGAITIYLKSFKHLKISFIRKLQYVYAGLFIIGTFIISTQLRSAMNFLLGVSQGWKVTEKGFEKPSGWKKLLLGKSFHIILVCICFLASVISWIVNFHMDLFMLINLLPLLFMGTNLLLCIIFFRRERRREHNSVEFASIDTRELDPTLV